MQTFFEKAWLILLFLSTIDFFDFLMIFNSWFLRKDQIILSLEIVFSKSEKMINFLNES